MSSTELITKPDKKTYSIIDSINSNIETLDRTMISQFSMVGRSYTTSSGTIQSALNSVERLSGNTLAGNYTQKAINSSNSNVKIPSSISGLVELLAAKYPLFAIAKLGTEIATKIGRKIIEAGERVWSERLNPSMVLGKLAEYIKVNAGDAEGQKIIRSVERAIYNTPIGATQAFEVGKTLASTVGKTTDVSKTTDNLFNITEKIAFLNDSQEYVDIAKSLNSALNGDVTHLTQLYGVSNKALEQSGFYTSHSVEERVNAINKALAGMGYDEGKHSRIRNTAFYQMKISEDRANYPQIRPTSNKNDLIKYIAKGRNDFFGGVEYQRDVHNQEINALNKVATAEAARIAEITSGIKARNLFEKPASIAIPPNAFNGEGLFLKFEDYDSVTSSNYLNNSSTAKPISNGKTEVNQTFNINNKIEKDADVNKVIEELTTKMQQGVKNGLQSAIAVN